MSSRERKKKHTRELIRTSPPCPVCGKPILDKPSRMPLRRTCGRACLSAYFAMTMLGSSNPHWSDAAKRFECEMCSSPFRRYGNAKARFCGLKCRAAWDRTRSGELSPKWNGGRSATMRRIALRRRLAAVASVALHKPKPSVSKRRCRQCRATGLAKGRDFHDECLALSRKSKVVPCSVCGDPIRWYPLRPSFRHMRCRDVSGKANPNWKGGITPANRALRNSREYAAWRRSVFTRDKYTCQGCGQVGGKLHADHIEPFAVAVSRRFDVDNGRTLCVPCHMKTPSYLGGGMKLKRIEEKRRAQPDLFDLQGPDHAL